MEREMIDAVGLVFEEAYAEALKDVFNRTKTAQAGGKVENTVERARVVPLHFRNSIKGWLIRVETRTLSEIGMPWN